jgi:hypothetical protein
LSRGLGLVVGAAAVLAGVGREEPGRRKPGRVLVRCVCDVYSTMPSAMNTREVGESKKKPRVSGARGGTRREAPRVANWPCLRR